eukprot:1775420-Amphidinium_carterae.1
MSETVNYLNAWGTQSPLNATVLLLISCDTCHREQDADASVLSGACRCLFVARGFHCSSELLVSCDSG